MSASAIQKKLAAVAVAGMFLISSNNALFAAPAAGGGGGAAAGGGGHASGGGTAGGGTAAGGGGHASGGESGGGTAPAAGAHQTGGNAGGGQVHESNGASNGASTGAARTNTAGENTARTGGQTLTLPNAGRVTSEGSTQTNTAAKRSGNGERTTGQHLGTAGTERRLTNPYYRNNLNNQAYGNVYGSYPWLPFSYGYNNGWYGNEYGNNQYPFYIPTDPYPVNNDNYNDQTSTPSSQQQPGATSGGGTVGGTTSVQTPTFSAGVNADVQAQISNAVEKSPAMVTSNNSVQTAQSAFDAERERVLAALRQKPEYQQAMDRRHKAAGDVNAAQTKAGSDSPAVVAAASEKLDAGDEVTKLEEQAVATDPAASAAKGRLDQAVSDRNALRAQLTVQYQAAAKGG